MGDNYVDKYRGPTGKANPDWVITDGVNKNKTVDAMYTTNNLTPKEVAGVNKGFSINFARGTEKDTIINHLNKADFVVFDFRVLNSTNQTTLTNFVKTLPKQQQDKIIVIK